MSTKDKPPHNFRALNIWNEWGATLKLYHTASNEPYRKKWLKDLKHLHKQASKMVEKNQANGVALTNLMRISSQSLKQWLTKTKNWSHSQIVKS